MSNTEDYLDSLLNNINSVNMTGKSQLQKGEDLSSAKSEEIIRRYEKEQAYKKEQEQKRQEEHRREANFLKAFEGELEGEDADDFLHQFELELDAEKADPLEHELEKEEGFFKNIEGIVQDVSKEEGTDKNQDADAEKDLKHETIAEERLTKDESEFLTDVLGPEVSLEEVISNNIQEDVLGEHNQKPQQVADESGQEEFNLKELDLEEDPTNENVEDENLADELPLEELSLEELPLEEQSEEEKEEPELEYATEEEMGEETGDDDLLNLLSGMQDDEDISEIGDLLKANQENIELEESGLEVPKENAKQPEKSSTVSEEKPSAKKKDTKKKGFFGKIADALFGEDEDKTEETDKKKEVVIPEAKDLENISEENLEILKELETAEQTERAEQEETNEKKGKKRREKKPKKEKTPKEKKERKKREKKPKPPKEKDNTPPLPKKPVILIFLMAASMIVLVLLLSNSVGYSSHISLAKDAMDNAEYTKAYRELTGLDLKKSDEKLYKKVEAMAVVQAQYDSYVTLMSANEYELALDALIRGIGRYDAKLPIAKKYGLEKQLNSLEAQIEEALDEQFNLNAEDARELYDIKKRKEYSTQIHKIIQELNLGQVEE